MFAAGVVAEPVCGWLKHREGLDIRFLLQCIRASRLEGNRHVVTSVLRRLLNARAAAQNDQVSERNPLAARLRAVELLLNSLQGLQHCCQLLWLVDFPILLRRQTNAPPVRSTAHIGAAER